MDDFFRLGSVLFLLLVANGTPVLLSRLMGRYADWPLDGGLVAWDGHRLLGEAKTWRGVLGATGACTLLGSLLGYDTVVAALFGLFAMAGDSLSSFIKRRLSLRPSSQAMGLDQLPESLLPLWLLKEALVLGWGEIVLLTLLFLVLEQALSKLLYHWHIRKRPY